MDTRAAGLGTRAPVQRLETRLGAGQPHLHQETRRRRRAQPGGPFLGPCVTAVLILPIPGLLVTAEHSPGAERLRVDCRVALLAPQAAAFSCGTGLPRPPGTSETGLGLTQAPGGLRRERQPARGSTSAPEALPGLPWPPPDPAGREAAGFGSKPPSAPALPL